MKAVGADANANDPRSLGIIGKMHVSFLRQKFSGTVFIVTRDGSRSQDNRFVQGTDYYVASVELSGRSPWIGTEAQFGFNHPTPDSTGVCCGSPTICVPNQGPGPEPCDPLNGLCLSLNLGVTPIIPPILNTRFKNGLPPINLFVFPTERLPVNASGGSGDPVSSAGVLPGPSIFNACTNIVDPSCARASGVCHPGDPGYTENNDGQGDLGSGSEGCGQPWTPGESGGNPLAPDICKIVEFTGAIPEECGGECPNCEHSANGTWDRVPPGCAYALVTPDSDLCNPVYYPGSQAAALNNAQMQLKVGWIPGQAVTSCQWAIGAPGNASPPGRYVNTANLLDNSISGFRLNPNSGDQNCTSCDAQGNCSQTRIVPPCRSHNCRYRQLTHNMRDCALSGR